MNPTGANKIRRKRHRLRALVPLGSAFVFLVALGVIIRTLKAVDKQDLLIELSQVGRWTLVCALGLTVLAYLIMTGYDHLGVRYVGHRLGIGKVTFFSLLGYAFSNSLGTPLGAGTVRLRIYSGWGLPGGKILSLLFFTTASAFLGLVSLAGIVLLFNPIPDAVDLPLSGSTLPLGLVLLSPVGFYLAMCGWWRRTIRIHSWSLQLPSRRLACGQLLVGSLDWFVAALVFYILLTPNADVPFATFLAVFLLAQLAGIASNVPGGLGVFDTIVLQMIGPLVEYETIVGALIMFRAIYYLLPLACAGLLLGGLEMARHSRKLGVAYGSYQRIAGPTVPLAMTVLVFVAGVSMIVVGALPAADARLFLLHEFLPLSAIEISNLLGSMVGTLLLFLAVALYRRVNAAYAVAVVLMSAGIVLSLLRGLQWEAALAQGIVLAALLPCRHRFYRRARLLEPRTGWPWLVAMALAVGTSVALGFVVFSNIPYRDDLWWQMSLTAEAPRFLRAAVASGFVVLTVCIAWLLRPARVLPAKSSGAELAVAHRIVTAFPYTYAHLVLLGDKQLLFNPSHSGFVMYGMQGGSWIAMGDPVARKRSEQEELAWQFREQCDRRGVRCVFYKVSAHNLSLYLDMGLTLLKLGEDGRVPLADFTMEGAGRRSLRREVSRAMKAGCSFEVLPAAEVQSLIPRLRGISDAWLRQKRGEEKGFALGFFDEAYLSRLPVAVVRHDGAIVAFSNLWLTGEELSPDMIRHIPEAPPSTMDFLITNLMLWGQAEGYQWFNLGGAPLSGLKDRTLAPLWHRLGTRLYRHGEHFYNFEGLRQFKEKFNPVWEPKYLAIPAGWNLPLTLLDLTRLIGRNPSQDVGQDDNVL